MARTHSGLPTYRRHRPSGQAVVSFGRADIYLGPWKSKRSLAEYDRLIAEYIANGRRAPIDNGATHLTITELIAQYWRFAKDYYVKDGKPTDTQWHVRRALKEVRHLYGRTQAVDFGPLALKAVRERIASGGHTQLVLVHDWGEYEVLGKTRDDAAGEAFDEVGKLLEVGYPGGPFIEKIAAEGNDEAIRFPRAYLGEGSYDFSFSGLKTAVLNYVREIGSEETQRRLADIAASFQRAVVDVLVEKTIGAAVSKGVTRVCLAGGVAVNKMLRKAMAQRGEVEGVRMSWPPPDMCTDNGGMIAAAGHHALLQGRSSPLSLSPAPSLNL